MNTQDLIARLRGYLAKASFAVAGDRHSALSCLDDISAALSATQPKADPFDPKQKTPYEMGFADGYAKKADERGSAEPGELPPACRSIGGCALATAPARAGSEPDGDFWQWLSRAYRDSNANTSFTAYNMEVAYEAGRAALAATPEQPAQAQPAVEGLTEEVVRKAFRVYDERVIARRQTPWQIWRDAVAALTAAPKAEPEPIERNFCTRCGKRLVAGDVHTCTPPREGSEHA